MWPGCQQGGAGAHGADQVDGQVATAIIGQGEPRLSVLQPSDVVGLAQARGHSLPHLEPFPDVFGLREDVDDALPLGAHCGPILGQGHHGACVQKPVAIRVAHFPAHTIGGPVVGVEVGWLRGLYHQVLHVPPCEVLIGLQGESNDAGC